MTYIGILCYLLSAYLGLLENVISWFPHEWKQPREVGWLWCACDTINRLVWCIINPNFAGPDYNSQPNFSIFILTFHISLMQDNFNLAWIRNWFVIRFYSLLSKRLLVLTFCASDLIRKEPIKGGTQPQRCLVMAVTAVMGCSQQTGCWGRGLSDKSLLLAVRLTCLLTQTTVKSLI